MHVGAFACLNTCAFASGPVEHVYLSAPVVAVKGKEANLTVVVWPSHVRTLTFFWWFDNSSEVGTTPLFLHLPFNFSFFKLPFPECADV